MNYFQNNITIYNSVLLTLKYNQKSNFTLLTLSSTHYLQITFSIMSWWWWFSHQGVSDSCNPMDCNLPDSSVHGDFPGKNTGVGYHCLLQGRYELGCC